MANNTLTQDQLEQLRQTESSAKGWKGNVAGTDTRQYTNTTTGGTEAKETKSPSSTTSTQYTLMDDEVLAGANAAKESYLNASSAVTKDGDKYVSSGKNFSDVIPMRKAVEETEKQNRLKQLNSALFNTLSTISDIAVAGAGGNVHKREKDTTIADAAKDTQARKDALLTAEANAKAADKKAFEEVLANAQKAYDDYITKFGKKVTNAETSGGEVTRTLQQITPTTTSVSTHKSPDAIETTDVAIFSSNGTPVTHSVDKRKVQEYYNAVVNDLTTQANNTSSALYQYLSTNNLIDSDTGKPKTNAIKTIMASDNYYQFLSDATKRMNRDLLKHTRAFNEMILSDEYKRFNEYQRWQKQQEFLNGRFNATEGDDGFDIVRGGFANTGYGVSKLR